jgi:hypothetical protein
MSATNPGPGRPSGLSEATLEKQRRVRDAEKLGIPRATIAVLEKCSVGYVGMLINGGAKEDGSPEPVADIEPPQPRRLSRRAAQVRAWEHAEQHVISKLGLAVDAFWVRIVVAIHHEGDGYRLHIGGKESRFKSREDLCDLFGRREVDIKGWVGALVERGRLTDIDGVDIGIPHGMKLTPAENIRAKKTAKRAVQPQQDGQVSMLEVVRGGLSDASEIPSQMQVKPLLNLHGDASKILNSATENANTIPVIADTQTAAAAANTKQVQTLNSSSSNGSRAGVGELNLHSEGISVAPNASEITPSSTTEIILQRSVVGALTDRLLALAGITRPAKPDEVGVVEGWIAKGFRTDAICAVIESKMKERDGKPLRTLRYFDGLMTEALGPKTPTTVIALPQSPTPARAAVSEADLALDARLEALACRHEASKLGPEPPTRAGFVHQCRLGQPADGMRWITVLENLWQAELIDAAEMPTFHDYMSRPRRYADEMAEIEAACASPPQAAD